MTILRQSTPLSLLFGVWSLLAMPGCSLWASSLAEGYTGDGGGVLQDASPLDASDAGNVDAPHDDSSMDATVDAPNVDAAVDVAADSASDTQVDANIACGPDMDNAPACLSSAPTRPHCYRHVCVTRVCRTDSDCTNQSVLAGFQCINNTCTDCDWDDDGIPHRTGDVSGSNRFNDGCRVPFGTVSDCNDQDQMIAPQANRCGGWSAAAEVAPGVAVDQLALRAGPRSSTTSIPDYELYTHDTTQSVAARLFNSNALSGAPAQTPFGRAEVIACNSALAGVEVAFVNGQRQTVVARRVPRSGTYDELGTSIDTFVTMSAPVLRGLALGAQMPSSGGAIERPLLVAQYLTPAGAPDWRLLYTGNVPGILNGLPTAAPIDDIASLSAPLPNNGLAHLFYLSGTAAMPELRQVPVGANLASGGAPTVGSPVGGASNQLRRLARHTAVRAATDLPPSNQYVVAGVNLSGSPIVLRVQCDSSCALLEAAVVPGISQQCNESDLIWLPDGRAMLVAACGEEILAAEIFPETPFTPMLAFGPVHVLVRSGYLGTAPGLAQTQNTISIDTLTSASNGTRFGIAFVARRGLAARVFFQSFELN